MARKASEVSPIGTASYAWLNKPDEGKKFSDGKYKVTLVLPKFGADNQEEIDAFVESLNDRHEKAAGDAGTPSPVKDGDMKRTKNDAGKKVPDERFANTWYMTFKTTYAPTCVGAGNKKLPEDMQIFSGDLIRVQFTAGEYDTGTQAGITLYLGAVKLIEKRNAGAGETIFDDDEGVQVGEVNVSTEDDDSDF